MQLLNGNGSVDRTLIKRESLDLGSKRASLVAPMVKNLPAIWQTRVRSLDREDPLKKRIAIHSSILAWRIPRTEESGGLQSMPLERVIYDRATNTHKEQKASFL